MIKRINPIPFKSEYKSSAFPKPRGCNTCNREQLSLRFCLSTCMTSQIDLLPFSIEKNDQLYFVTVVE